MITSSVINFENWPIEWRILLCSGWVVLIILNCGFRFYIYKEHLNKMIRAFSRSAYIVDTAAMLEGQRFMTRRLLINFITGALKHSEKMINLDYVSAQDIHDCPYHFKVMLYAQDIATKVSAAWALILLIVILIFEK